MKTHIILDMPGVPRRMSMDPDRNRSNPGSKPASRPGSLEMSIAEDSGEDEDNRAVSGGGGGEDNPVFNEPETADAY